MQRFAGERGFVGNRDEHQANSPRREGGVKRQDRWTRIGDDGFVAGVERASLPTATHVRLQEARSYDVKDARLVVKPPSLADESELVANSTSTREPRLKSRLYVSLGVGGLLNVFLELMKVLGVRLVPK
ncbi:MAG: hypothetical protein ABIQ16_28825 [Polyangiaceae bacterium]